MSLVCDLLHLCVKLGGLDVERAWEAVNQFFTDEVTFGIELAINHNYCAGCSAGESQAC